MSLHRREARNGLLVCFYIPKFVCVFSLDILDVDTATLYFLCDFEPPLYTKQWIYNR